MKPLKLKKTDRQKYEVEENEKVVSNEVQQPTISPQTPAMDHSFHYQMAQRISQKLAKYEAMMPNAF